MNSSLPCVDDVTESAGCGYARTLVFYVNGQRFELERPDPKALLVDFLRSTEIGLTGTKHSCGQGGCGACTVTLSRYDEHSGQVVHLAANSCLRPLCSLDGMQVTTVEGIGSVQSEIAPVQHEIAACNGSQCGYCTPGFVMNMHSFLLKNEGRPLTEQQIQDNFDGNICRCTGFRPILYAMKTFAADRDAREAAGTPPCYVDPAMAVPVAKGAKAEFPAELRVAPRAVAYEHRGSLWYRPLELKQVHELLHEHREREVKLVVGNTTVGIPDVNPRNPGVYIDISHLDELHRFEATEKHLVVGAAVTYSELIDRLEALLPKAPAARATGLKALNYMAGRTAGTIVRNMASLAGNTMLVARNATEGGTPFPSDLFTALCALDASVVVQTRGEEVRLRVLEFIERYVGDTGFRQEAVLLRYEIPHTVKGEILTTYKVALREVNSHSLVNAGIGVRLGAGKVVERATLVFGAIAPVAFHARRTEKFLTGKVWSAGLYAEAAKVLAAEVREVQQSLPAWFTQLPTDGIEEQYRRSLAEAFFFKFYVEVSEKVSPGSISKAQRSAGVPYAKRGVSWGSQTFAKPSEGAAAGQPFIKLTAFEQATGEAIYTHDVPVPVRGLQGSFVTSMAANAKFRYQIKGPGGAARVVKKAELVKHLRQRFAQEFVDYITCDDIPKGGKKGVSPSSPKDPLDPWFCDGAVTCFGQSIGLIVAQHENPANEIAAYVREHCIAYTSAPAKEIVLDIDRAVELKQFFAGYTKKTDDNQSIQSPGYAGNKHWVGKSGPQVVGGQPCEVVNGRQYTGAQVHFYMETQSCVAYPGEGGDIMVHSSTQSANSVQSAIQQTLLLQANQISVDVKSLGGAYGGKTTRSPFVAVPAALAAAKLRRPVRVAVPREVDTWMIGNRHPFRGDYSLAIVSEGPQKGKIMGSSTRFYSNGGNTPDCSFDVMDCAQLGADNAYSVPYFFTEGQVCRTNLHSSGAMRSYGGVQAMLIQEDALEAAAHKIGMSPEAVREMNFYKNGEKTPFGQTLEYCYIKEVWERLKRTSNFEARQKAVKEFNAGNRWRKRGISMIPLKYGLGYNLGFLMQGGAYVDVYNDDGTVLVQIGGIEMGQGIMTKMAQIAADILNVPLRLVRVASTQTNIIADAVSTGATSGTDLCGGAVKEACEELVKNLKGVCHAMLDAHGEAWCQQNHIDYWNYPEGWQAPITGAGAAPGAIMWKSVLSQAYQNRVDMSAQALYSTPGMVDATDQQFYGYTFSAACSEVEIDVLTGETTVVRSDLCYDIGESINPAIDIGQVEGAFMMGLGYVTSEDVIFEPEGPAKGTNNTPNTWTYKPPASTSIPLELHVDLFPRDDASEEPVNPDLLMGSKGVGEPPLVLASTVFFAIKHAILAARQDRGQNEWFALKSPATVQRVQEACAG